MPTIGYHASHRQVPPSELLALAGEAERAGFGAAITPEMARWVAEWADGVITINRPPEQRRPVVDAVRAGDGAGKPMALQVHPADASTDDGARCYAVHRWRTTVLPSSVLADLRTPAPFEAAARFVTPVDTDASVRISADLDRHLAWLRDNLATGFDRISLHEVGPDQRAFIAAFGRQVFPAFADG